MDSWLANKSRPDAEFKAMSGQINVDEAEGVVECFVAAIGNKDSVGDIILPGAFSASLRRRKPRVVWGHNWNEPIGKVLDIYEVGPTDPRLPRKMKEAGVGGLFAKVQFNMKAERGRQAFLDVAFFGEEQEWSIGYKTLNADYDNLRKANLLREVELYEVSPVLHGANQLTSTLSVKADDGENRQFIEDELTFSDSVDEKALAIALAKMMGGAVRIRRIDPDETEFDHLGDNDDVPTRSVVPYRQVDGHYMFGPARMRQQLQSFSGENDAEEDGGGIANSEYPVTSRQRNFYEAIEDVVEKFGRFDQSAGPDGAHYVEKSPFIKDGLVCSNCVFYSGGRSCEVVSGDIDPNGICKLWQIPATLLRGEAASSMVEEESTDGGDRNAPDDELISFLRRRIGMNNSNPDPGSEEKIDGKCGSKCRCGGQCGGSIPDRPAASADLPSSRMLARAISAKIQRAVRILEMSSNTIIFDVMTDAGVQTWRMGWHSEGGQIMLGRAESVKPETVYLSVDDMTPNEVFMDGFKAPIPPDAIPQERFTGDVLRGYGPRRGNLERLLRYWRPIMRQPGGFRRCRVILANHPELYPLNNICAWLHHETTGLWPNEGCHHPTMKNCRRKLRGVVRGSIWSDRQWNDRLSRIPGPKKSLDGGWVYPDDEDMGNWDSIDQNDEETFDEMLARGQAELIKFCRAEPDFVAYVGDAKNWYVEGEFDDGSTGEHAVMKEYCSDCDSAKDASAEVEFAELLGELSEKAGRALSGRNLDKLRQALMLLQEVVSTGGEPVEMKSFDNSYGYDVLEDSILIELPVDAIFDFKSLVDPIFDNYNLESIIDETGVTVKGFTPDQPEAKDAVLQALHNLAFEENA